MAVGAHCGSLPWKRDLKRKRSRDRASETDEKMDVSIIKKGILLQKKEGKLFGKKKLKERYLILTQDYLNCFKVKRRKDDSDAGHREEDEGGGPCFMGLWLFGLRLYDIVDKIKLLNEDLVIDDGLLVLTSEKAAKLESWLKVLMETCQQSSLKRQSMLRKQQKEHKIQQQQQQQHQQQREHLNPILYYQQMFSVSTTSLQRINRDDPPESYSSKMTPLLAPQCKGVERERGRDGSASRQRSSPHSLLISPSLTQRSLYAQQILSSSSSSSLCFTEPRQSIKNRFLASTTSSLLLPIKCSTMRSNMKEKEKDPGYPHRNKLKTANSEFSFIKLGNNSSNCNSRPLSLISSPSCSSVSPLPAPATEEDKKKRRMKKIIENQVKASQF